MQTARKEYRLHSTSLQFARGSWLSSSSAVLTFETPLSMEDTLVSEDAGAEWNFSNLLCLIVSRCVSSSPPLPVSTTEPCLLPVSLSSTVATGDLFPNSLRTEDGCSASFRFLTIPGAWWDWNNPPRVSGSCAEFAFWVGVLCCCVFSAWVELCWCGKWGVNAGCGNPWNPGPAGGL